MIKNKTLLQSSAMYETGERDKIPGVFTSSSSSISNMSKTYASADLMVTAAIDSLNQTGLLFSSNAVSNDMVKEMYATSYKASRQ